MSFQTDPKLYESGFARLDKDRYWTDPWLTRALLDTVSVPRGTVWEPAAGRGDIVSVLLEYGMDVVASDIDLSEFDASLCASHVGDFLDEVPDSSVSCIITNPPYNQPRGVAEKFVRRAVDMMSFTNVEFVAVLLRSEFCRAKGRRAIFGDCPNYYGEVVLTKRPRWDWWFREYPESGPRHNFSWFVWTRHHRQVPSVQMFHYEPRKSAVKAPK
jgi:hypothetical protein